ncbi:hypothetical protein ACQP25_16970 [Microtetraspora malaysiensis]|uniref:hypothetical protein n=1 Tax=Microtetraspora malaysiensis TaxID=161358 RepID=UPI003D90CC47
MNLHGLNAKLKDHHKGLAAGAVVAFFAGLVILGDVWALVIMVVGLVIGAALGGVGGMAISDRENAARINTLEADYEAASELAYKLNEELHAAAQRAESAERDLIATVAEKTTLRAQLDAHQGNGSA